MRVNDDAQPFLVTGSTGFIGAAICRELRRRGIPFRHALRAPAAQPEPAVVIGDIGPRTDWTAAVKGVRVVLHIAGYAHAYGPAHRQRMFAVNADGTAALAAAASRAGVQRLVLLSTAKVHGEVSPSTGFREDDPLCPGDDYARSKVAAEESVRAQRGLDSVMIRAPLVYGAGVKANFLALMRALDRGMPLPLGAIDTNRRSLIYVENLVDALLLVAMHQQAAGETFLVADDEAVSSRELATRIASALGRRPRFLSMPAWALKAAGAAVGRRESVSRLTESLTVSTERIRAATGWRPKITMNAGLTHTAAWYRDNHPRST